MIPTIFHTDNQRSEEEKVALSMKFEKLTPREHVLKRPDTYVGSVEFVQSTMWVLEEKPTPHMVERPIKFVPALYKIFDEILVNAADNKQRDATMKEIRIDLEEGGRITVKNDGKGIPIEMHQQHQIYIPEMIFGHLLTGENFNDQEERIVGGRNGYGAKLANIFSTSFTVETNDKASEQCYTQTWTNNMQDVGKPKIIKAKAKDYTKISFLPDYARFGMSTLDVDTMALLKKRVYDIAGVLDKTVKVYLNGEAITCANSFEKYVRLYLPTEAKVVFLQLNPRWQIAVLCSKEANPTQVSFVNSICTYKGGQHVTYIQDQLVKAVQEYLEKKHKDMVSVVKPQNIRNHLWVFVNAMIVNPAFDSQTKENLTTRSMKFGPKEFLPEIKEETLIKMIKTTGILDQVLFWASQKQAKDLSKVGASGSGGKKRTLLMDIPKLDDANLAGGKKAKDCTLILTEGDSAKTLALSGISVVGRDYFGVFPLKGKPLNVREAGHVQIMKNVELQQLMKILGLKPGEKYESVDNLRYGHVMIMTDQDQDGSHIKGLVFNFFHFYFPSLISLPGFLQVFVTPLVKVFSPQINHAFYSLREYETWTSQMHQEIRTEYLAKHPNTTEDVLKTLAMETLKKKWRIKYYKGLGTNSSKEAQEYFEKMIDHSIQMVFDADSGNAIDMAFSKARVADRKQWLLGYHQESFVPVDFRAKQMDYRTFVNGELILFSLADNVRSIPSVMDGFKPSQRKVLYACMKRHLTQEIKVSQLAGYVSEHAAYHHGEDSLSGTIVGMAQTFVGSNNIALLSAGGAFGTRRMGGKDSASPRYIFTKLERITRTLFHPSDEALLSRMEDDGMIVEPNYYVPILPMLLVNGSSGIGTGWSTYIPSYHPRTILEHIRARLGGPAATTAFIPYFRGFTGELVEDPKRAGTFLMRGRYELNGDQLRITELPVGTWTASFKDFLVDSMRDHEGGGGGTTKAGGIPTGGMKEIRENHSDETVSFELILSPEFAKTLVEGGHSMVMSTFNLQSSISTTNMHAFDSKGLIRKYDSPLAILEEFLGVRLALYHRRKQHLEQELEKLLDRLNAQAKFIRMIIHDELRVSKKPKDELDRELSTLGFPRIFKEGEESEEGGGYSYLLSMPLSTLQLEKSTLLEQRVANQLKELEELRRKTPEELWLEDLIELDKQLIELDQAAALVGKKQIVSSSSRGGVPSKKKKSDGVTKEEQPKKKKVKVVV